MRIKRLGLEGWMKSERARSTCEGFVETPRILFKDGYYKCGDVVWFEVDGKAFIFYKNDGMFDYVLKCIDAWHGLNIHAVLALEGVIKQGLATKKQVEIYTHYLDYADRRRMLRDFDKRFLFSKS